MPAERRATATGAPGRSGGSDPPGRDDDRSSVYAAEDLVHRLLERSVDFPTIEVAGSSLTVAPERKFASIESIGRYVNGVLALPSVVQRWPERVRVPVSVRERRGAGKAHYEFDSATMAIPTGWGGAGWAMRELVVLHELAHHLAGPSAVRHGREFRATLLDLIDTVLGPELRLLLYVSYADAGIGPV